MTPADDWPIGEARIYRWASVTCRRDTKSIEQMEREGWKRGSDPTKWGSILMEKKENENGR